MQVIEDQQQRLVLTRPLEQARNRRIQQVTLGLGVAFARWGKIRHAVTKGGHQAREDAAKTLDVPIEDRLRSLFHQVAERLHPRLVWHAEVLVAAPVENRRALPVHRSAR